MLDLKTPKPKATARTTWLPWTSCFEPSVKSKAPSPLWSLRLTSPPRRSSVSLHFSHYFWFYINTYITSAKQKSFWTPRSRRVSARSSRPAKTPPSLSTALWIREEPCSSTRTSRAALQATQVGLCFGLSRVSIHREDILDFCVTRRPEQDSLLERAFDGDALLYSSFPNQTTCVQKVWLLFFGDCKGLFELLL